MAIKPSDQEIGALYREAGSAEPSAELDHSILMAARAAVAPKPLPSAWWQRWRLPIQVLASVFAVASLVVMMERKPPDAPAVGQIALNTLPPAADSARTESLAMDKAMPPVADNRARMAESAPVQRMPAAPAASVAREISAPPAESVAAASAPAPAVRAASVAADAAALPTEKSEAAGSAEAKMTARQAAAPAANAVLREKEWLDAIRLLIDQGRVVEARTSLEAFERAYPAVVVPEAMRKQLKQ
ncbi:MAG: hypothetical protein Q8S26_02725 [Azonexus sp.]|nr:hypothetical protein [Azonexus sp.]